MEHPQLDTPSTPGTPQVQVIPPSPLFSGYFAQYSEPTTAASTNAYSTPSTPSTPPTSFTPSSSSTALTQSSHPLSDEVSLTSHKNTEEAVVSDFSWTRARRIALKNNLKVNTPLANQGPRCRYAMVPNKCESDLHIIPRSEVHPEDLEGETNSHLRQPLQVEQPWLRSSCTKSTECRDWQVESREISSEYARSLRKTQETRLGLSRVTNIMKVSFEQTPAPAKAETWESEKIEKHEKKSRKEHEKREQQERKEKEKRWKDIQKERKEKEKRGVGHRHEKKSWLTKLSEGIDTFYS